MKLKNLMVLNAIVSAVFGIGFLLVPAQVMQLYGFTVDAQLIYVGHLFGASLVGFAFLSWLARDAADSDTRRAIILALFVAEGVGFIVALMGQLAGTTNMLGWSTIAVYLLFALGFGYFQFARPTSM